MHQFHRIYILLFNFCASSNVLVTVSQVAEIFFIQIQNILMYMLVACFLFGFIMKKIFNSRQNCAVIMIIKVTQTTLDT